MPELAGLRVVVTRPAHQAEGICQLLRQEGAMPLLFPVLEIVDVADSGHLDERIDQLDSYDIAIFISPNAVERGLQRILSRRNLPAHLRLAAVGSASARALRQHGLTPHIVPIDRFDSESLLALPDMQAVRGKRIIIFRGEGGRELLADTLRGRGAQVDYAECYRRLIPPHDSSVLMNHWERGGIDIIIVTSADGMRNLFDMVGPKGRPWLQQSVLVVVSARMVPLVKELGIKPVPLVAENASDNAVVAAIKQWHRSVKV